MSLCFNIRKDIYKLFTTKKYAHLSFRNTKSSIPSKCTAHKFPFLCNSNKNQSRPTFRSAVLFKRTYGRLMTNIRSFVCKLLSFVINRQYVERHVLIHNTSLCYTIKPNKRQVSDPQRDLIHSTLPN